MSRRLFVNDGKRERELVLVEKIVVGRDPACDVSHDDVLLSRRHAEFIAEPDQVTVRDLGSRNGIFINGLRAAERALESGDVVQIGPLRVRYAQDRAPASILPEHLIADATIVLPPPRPRPASPPAAPARRDGGEANAEDDNTRVLSPWALEAQRTPTPKPPPPPAVNPAHQEGPTLYMAPPAGAAAVAPRATHVIPEPQPHPLPDASSVRRNLEADISAYVFSQVAVVAGVVLFASLVPLLIGRGAALSLWVAIPFVAAVMTTYLVGRVINRRFFRILRALKPDVPLGGGPSR